MGFGIISWGCFGLVIPTLISMGGIAHNYKKEMVKEATSRGVQGRRGELEVVDAVMTPDT